MMEKNSSCYPNYYAKFIKRGLRSARVCTYIRNASNIDYVQAIPCVLATDGLRILPKYADIKIPKRKKKPRLLLLIRLMAYNMDPNILSAGVCKDKILCI